MTTETSIAFLEDFASHLRLRTTTEGQTVFWRPRGNKRLVRFLRVVDAQPPYGSMFKAVLKRVEVNTARVYVSDRVLDALGLEITQSTQSPWCESRNYSLCLTCTREEVNALAEWVASFARAGEAGDARELPAPPVDVEGDIALQASLWTLAALRAARESVSRQDVDSAYFERVTPV